ncbi:Uncharacterised protein [Mycobacterium tuberculosis]|uniref:Uncharacterized protein n=1 Tax=Mycobacterium tuberculosis TaxID=1773 RepID=A0A654TS57_MYCTX|nr:hypothetical protein TMLG_03975 [Mycobacterium tuberculosis SUMu012]CFE71198.1 Uncharacterised protein [Mycobacterium tuberculosis]CKN20457.1 Uncharacterised protein [Mycobacterium tuberculosis]CKN25224.1 Uncharacterised protein [Mycobacterium tuberculosis]CKP20065.1 Uncharacterised protein [Mycobacterium tuberculosis]
MTTALYQDAGFTPAGAPDDPDRVVDVLSAPVPVN